MLRIHRDISFQVVKRAARAPRPCAQSAPVVGLARLTMVCQADDSARKPGAVVGLNGGGVEQRKAPAVGNKLPGVGRITVLVHLWKLERLARRQLISGMLIEDSLQRRILLNEKLFHRSIDSRNLFLRRLVRRGKRG